MAHLQPCNIMKASRSLHAPRAAAAGRAAPLASGRLGPLRALPNLSRPLQPRQTMRLHALPPIGRLFGAAQLLQTIQGVWDKYDINDDGGLTLEEVTELLNSKELCDYVEQTTNVRPLQRTVEQVAPLFAEADTDNNRRLSRSEFVALYVRIVAQRVKTEPKVLLQALLGAIDWNRDGAINGGELKRLLQLAGIPGLVTLPIPDSLALTYTKASSLLGLPPPAPRQAPGSASKPAA